MITDDEISNLPQDQPELAFVEFEKILRARVLEKESEEDQYSSAEPYRLEYINKVVAAARYFKIDVLKDWQVPKTNSNVFETYKQFVTDVDHFTIQIRLARGSKNIQSSVGLDGNTKVKIRHFIDQIKTSIDSAELPNDKRDRLQKKLSDFALEVEKIRTGIQAAGAIYIAICSDIGEGFKKLEPVKRMVDSIAGLLGKAKEVEEGNSRTLAGEERPLQLEAPRRQLPPPEPKSTDLDDEIPF